MQGLCWRLQRWEPPPTDRNHEKSFRQAQIREAVMPTILLKKLWYSDGGFKFDWSFGLCLRNKSPAYLFWLFILQVFNIKVLKSQIQRIISLCCYWIWSLRNFSTNLNEIWPVQYTTIWFSSSLKLTFWFLKSRIVWIIEIMEI